MIPSKKHSFGFAHYYCFFFSFLFSTNRFGFLKDDRASMYAFCFQALHPSKLIRSVCFRSLHNIQSCISALKLHLSFFFLSCLFFFPPFWLLQFCFLLFFFFLMVEATFAGLLKKKKKPREHEGNEGSRKTRLRRGVDEASRLCERLHAASFFFFFPLKGTNQLYSSAEQEEDHRHHSYSFSSPSLWFFLKKVSEEGEHS